MLDVTVASIIKNSTYDVTDNNAILFNYKLDKRIMEETKECTCRKMSEDEIKKYC